jgi:tetratricopeptide (TPR) repeat protein
VTASSPAVERARLLIDAGRLENAVGVIEDQLSTDPGDADAWSYLALCHVRQARWDDAFRAGSEAVRLRPGLERGHRCLAYALRGLGRRPEAIQAAEECVRIEPHFWISHYVLATMLASCHDRARSTAVRQRAMDEAVEAVRLAPEEPQAHRQVANMLHTLGRKDEAAQALQRVLALDPADQDARAQLASLSKGRGALVALVAARMEALAARPDQIHAVYQVLIVLHRLLRRLRWLAAALVLVPVVSLPVFGLGTLPPSLGQRLYDLGFVAVVCAAVLRHLNRKLPPGGLRTVWHLCRRSLVMRLLPLSTGWCLLGTVVLLAVPWHSHLVVQAVTYLIWGPTAVAMYYDHGMRKAAAAGSRSPKNAADLYGK